MEATSRVMPVNELLRDIEVGRCSELFACGTGAIVAPIAAIGEADGKEWPLPEVGRLSSRLRDKLLDIQEGKTDDPFGWVIDAADSKSLAAYINS
jgi:branched-chain amino acid aminotransferase